MKTVNGSTSNIKKDVIGRISTERVGLVNRKGVILVANKVKALDIGYAGVVTTTPTSNPIVPTLCVSDLNSTMFLNGDIVSLTPSGQVHFLWETAQEHNALFLTEACNCRCVMCPQPPKPHDPVHINAAREVLRLLHSGYEGEICITGGEPTLCGDDFKDILSICRSRHPKSRLIVLTNGKSFSRFNFAKSVSELNTGAAFAVSYHADTDSLHDQIVGSKGSFRPKSSGGVSLKPSSAETGRRLTPKMVRMGTA